MTEPIESPAAPSRKFPGYAWAWPTGDRDTLLAAAALPDPVRAAAALSEFLRRRELDGISFPEQRLVAAISHRFAQLDPHLADRARIAGIERHLWARSRVALHSAAPIFDALNAHDIDLLVFKGASRSARNPSDLRGRVANDIDILVRAERFPEAARLIVGLGWRPKNPGRLRLYLAGRRDMAAMNFISPPHGDVDLHQFVFHHLASSGPEGLWDRAQPAELLGRPIWLPSATDDLAISIVHGGIGGHASSDWMLDCVMLIRDQHIDWDLFVDLAGRYGFAPHAAIALSYLISRLEVPVPGPVFTRLDAMARSDPSALKGALLLARPRLRHTALSRLRKGITNIGRHTRIAMWGQRNARLPIGESVPGPGGPPPAG